MNETSIWRRAAKVAVLATALSLAGGAVAQEAQTNREGMVAVTVTPLEMSAQARSWRFEVALNTHVSPLTEDLVAAAVLADDRGRTFKPVAWRGDAPGGHHRKGVLEFNAITPAPRSVTLTLHDVGRVKARVFTWPVPSR